MKVCGCFWNGLVWWFVCSSRHVSSGSSRLARLLSRSNQVPAICVIFIVEIVQSFGELVVCEFYIWWILSHISMESRAQGISLPVAEVRTWMKFMGFQYTHRLFWGKWLHPLPAYHAVLEQSRRSAGGFEFGHSVAPGSPGVSHCHFDAHGWGALKEQQKRLEEEEGRVSWGVCSS